MLTNLNYVSGFKRALKSLPDHSNVKTTSNIKKYMATILKPIELKSVEYTFSLLKGGPTSTPKFREYRSTR